MNGLNKRNQQGRKLLLLLLLLLLLDEEGSTPCSEVPNGLN